VADVLRFFHSKFNVMQYTGFISNQCKTGINYVDFELGNEFWNRVSASSPDIKWNS